MKVTVFTLTLLLSFSLSAATQFESLVVTPSSSFTSSTMDELEQTPGVVKVRKLRTFGLKGIAPKFIIKVKPDRYHSVKSLLEAKSSISEVVRDRVPVKINFVKKSKEASPDLNGYQWGLVNSGQTVIRSIDSLKNLSIYGVNGVDIGWKDVIDEFESNLKTTPAVAVPDFGVSWRHDDLIGQMLYNPKECYTGKKGRPQKLCKGRDCRLQRPERDENRRRTLPEDRDNNGLAGDCLGWNFTAEDNPLRAMDPNETISSTLNTEISGHGTHISGIIAANAATDLELKGVSNKIKILPLKIFNSIGEDLEEGEDDVDFSLDSLTSHIVESMAYAASKNVKVINASFGVPQAAVSRTLYNGIKAVLDSGVTIVAAAGNNDHKVPVFPCSMKGVICVGAISSDGAATDFTNFGGHVDLYAPGEQILSSFPYSAAPEFWPSRNYELMSGTSQAAPFVSAMVALMRSRWPKIKPDEVLGLLHQASIQTHTGNKFFAGGLPQLNKIKTTFDRAILKPQMKEISVLTFNPSTLEFDYPLVIENLGKSTGKVTVSVSNVSDNLVPSSQTFSVSKLNKGASFSRNVRLKLQSLSADSQSQIKITISENGKVRDYQHSFDLARDPQSDVGFKRLKVTQSEGLTRLIRITDRFESSDYPEYYWFDRSEEGERFRAYRKSGNELKKVADIKSNDDKQLQLITKLDLNYDGKPDYFLNYFALREKQGCEKTEEDECLESYPVYAYLDENFQPLFEGSDKIDATIDYAWLNTSNFSSLRFLPIKYKGQKLATPVFRSQGQVPEIDHNPDTFEKNLPGLFHYYQEIVEEDGKPVMRERILQRYDFRQNLQTEIEKHLGRPLYILYDEINYTQDLVQSQAQHENGTLEIVLRAGQDALSKSFILRLSSLDGEFELAPAAYDYQDFGTYILSFNIHFASSLIDLSGTRPILNGNAIVGFQGRKELRLSFLDEMNRESLDTSFTYRHPIARDDFIVGEYIQSYKKDDSYYAFLGTKQSLVAVVHDSKTGESKTSIRPLVRSDFIASVTSSQVLFPIAIPSRNGLEPAIYVNDSQLNSRRSFLWQLQEGKLVSPAGYSLFIPQGCFGRNPSPWGPSGSSALLAFCNSQSGLELLALEIK